MTDENTPPPAPAPGYKSPRVEVNRPDITATLNAIEGTHGTRFACLVKVNLSLIALSSMVRMLAATATNAQAIDRIDADALLTAATQCCADVVQTMAQVLDLLPMASDAMDYATEIMDAAERERAATPPAANKPPARKGPRRRRKLPPGRRY